MQLQVGSELGVVEVALAKISGRKGQKLIALGSAVRTITIVSPLVAGLIQNDSKLTNSKVPYAEVDKRGSQQIFPSERRSIIEIVVSEHARYCRILWS